MALQENKVSLSDTLKVRAVYSVLHRLFQIWWQLRLQFLCESYFTRSTRRQDVHRSDGQRHCRNMSSLSNSTVQRICIRVVE